MNDVSLLDIAPEFTRVYPIVSSVADSVHDALSESEWYHQGFDYEVDEEIGLVVLRNVLKDGFTEKVIERIEQCGMPGSAGIDRALSGIISIKGSRFNPQIDLLAGAIRKLGLCSSGFVHFNSNEYYQGTSSESGKGVPHTDIFSISPIILTAVNEGGIEVATGMIDKKTFEDRSQRGDNRIVEYGPNDVGVFNGALFSHRGFGSNPANPRKSVVVWQHK